jgi:hypothetical protein
MDDPGSMSIVECENQRGLARFDALLRGAAPTTEDAKRLDELLADIALRPGAQRGAPTRR